MSLTNLQIIAHSTILMGGLLSTVVATKNLIKIKQPPKRMLYYLVPFAIYLLGLWLVPNHHIDNNERANGFIITTAIIITLGVISVFLILLRKQTEENWRRIIYREGIIQKWLIGFLVLYCLCGAIQLYRFYGTPNWIMVTLQIAVQFFFGIAVEGEFTTYKKLLEEKSNFRIIKVEKNILKWLVISVILSSIVTFGFLQAHGIKNLQGIVTTFLTATGFGLLIILFISVVLFNHKNKKGIISK